MKNNYNKDLKLIMNIENVRKEKALLKSLIYNK